MPHSRAPTAHRQTLPSYPAISSLPCLGPVINRSVTLPPFHSTLWKRVPHNTAGETEAQQGQGIYSKNTLVVSIGTKICSHILPGSLFGCIYRRFLAVPWCGSGSFLMMLPVTAYRHAHRSASWTEEKPDMFATDQVQISRSPHIQTGPSNSIRETRLLCTALRQPAARLWFRWRAEGAPCSPCLPHW